VLVLTNTVPAVWVTWGKVRTLIPPVWVLSLWVWLRPVIVFVNASTLPAFQPITVYYNPQFVYPLLQSLHSSDDKIYIVCVLMGNTCKNYTCIIHTAFIRERQQSTNTLILVRLPWKIGMMNPVKFICWLKTILPLKPLSSRLWFNCNVNGTRTKEEFRKSDIDATILL
jgi:hypothetical protein